MFFSVSNKLQKISEPFFEQVSFPHHSLLLDRGWHKHKNIFYKGYSIGPTLTEKVKNKDFSEVAGNYTILDFTNGDVRFYTDDTRSFPLYYSKNTLSNVLQENLQPVWFDGTADYSNQSWKFKFLPYNTINHDATHNILSKNEIVDFFCDYIIETCNNFQSELPVFAVKNPGVDSLVVRSAFDYCNKSYVLQDTKEIKYTNLGWGYNQLYDTNQPHTQITGFCGDEIFLRNPMYCQWLLDPHGIDLIEEFEKIEYSYMKGFFQQNYHKKLLNRTLFFNNVEDSYNHTANVVINDFQMWHLNDTITFTPFRNLNVLKEVLYADIDVILDQVIHAGISKAVIEKLNPALLQDISKHKNNCMPV